MKKLLFLAIMALQGVVSAQSVFTYQGRLSDTNGAANGTYEFRFSLLNSPTGNTLGVLTNSAIVSNGVFTANLDFGPALFDGGPRYLNIGVRTNGDANDFSSLNPAQPINATPYSIYATKSATAVALTGTIAATNITGVINNAQLSTNVARLDVSQTFTAKNSFAALGINKAPTADAALDVKGNIYANLGDILFSVPGDHNHGIGYYGMFNTNKLFAGVNVDGPVLYGYTAGALGTISGGQRIALQWSNGVLYGNGSGLTNLTLVGNGAAITNLNLVGNGAGITNLNASAITGVGMTLGDTQTNLAFRSSLLGGIHNRITNSLFDCAIIAGEYNEILGGYDSVIAGGYFNHIGNSISFIGAGYGNRANGYGSFVPAGEGNIAGGTYSFAGGYYATANHDGTFVWTDTTGGQFASTSNNQFLVRATGGVGINTTTPQRSLQVGDANTGSEGMICLASHSATTAAERVWEIGVPKNDTNANNQFYSFVIDDTQLGTNAEFMVQFGTGNVGIGTVNPSFLLHVNGSAGKPGGGSWATASDLRLKKNIEPIQGALERLLSVRGVTFEYKDPAAINELSGRQNGVIAQEVEKVFPQWVETAKDGYKRVTFRGFEALVIEALRDLKAEQETKLSELERKAARVAALEERVKELEQKDAERDARLANLEAAVLRVKENRSTDLHAQR